MGEEFLQVTTSQKSPVFFGETGNFLNPTAGLLRKQRGWKSPGVGWYNQGRREVSAESTGRVRISLDQPETGGLGAR